MASSKFCTVLSLALFLVLLTHANSANDIFFNIDRFNETNLILQGDATVSSKGQLELTDETSDSMGRAFYSAPIQMRDSTGNASFDTNFTFNMRPSNKVTSGYGLAFALVPVDSQPKRKGRLLGLFNTPENDINAHTVAVVFDTFSNRIGIDVNSVQSIESKSWDFRHYKGQKAEVRITYNSSSKVLAASLFYPSPGKRYDVSAKVELEEVLDDWVSVGFSATSAYKETHDVLSWSFSSSLSDDTTSEPSNILLNKIL
uniref:Alpha-amylase inhibitor-like protein n=1 Tax=Phaseolus lunatus TaxID=3884 RepID=Q9LED6_PHALU|nr:alpha-amylase inhibitor-like protein [Phaseolus lunatus]